MLSKHHILDVDEPRDRALFALPLFYSIATAVMIYVIMAKGAVTEVMVSILWFVDGSLSFFLGFRVWPLSINLLLHLVQCLLCSFLLGFG